MGLGCLGAAGAPWSKIGLVAGGALFLWAGISLSWSPARPWLTARGLVSAIEHVSLVELGLLALLAALATRAALAFEPAAARLPASAWRWSILALAVVLAVDSALGGRIYGALAAFVSPAQSADLMRIYAARGGYVLAVLMWPWLGALQGRARWLAPAPFLAVTAVSGLLHEAAPLVGLAAGAAAFVLVLAAGARGVAVLGAAQAAYWLGAPWAVRLADRVFDFGRLSGTVKASWSVRLGIWRFAADRVAEHPWRGWGLDAARAFGDSIPLHPHDGAVQVWLELGLPGAVMVTALWLGLLRRVGAAPDRLQRAAAAGAMSAYLAIGAVSFGVWQPWWLAVGILATLGSIVAARAYRKGGA
jgi:O-antigen ligase